MDGLDFLFRKAVMVLPPLVLCQEVPDVGLSTIVEYRKKLRKKFKEYYEAKENDNTAMVESTRSYLSWFIADKYMSVFHPRGYATDYYSYGQYLLAVDILSIFVACPDVVSRGTMYEIYRELKKCL